MPEDLETKCVAHVSKELEAMGLGVWKTVEGEECLHTTKALREHDVIGSLTGLMFDSATRVAAFLSEHT
eukprot:6340854-Alexandrium_andersonii.AAC.1